MKTLTLTFRAKMPNGSYFLQDKQHLTSFLRRVLMFWSVEHPSYLEENLEEKLEIFIEGEWVKCEF